VAVPPAREPERKQRGSRRLATGARHEEHEDRVETAVERRASGVQVSVTGRTRGAMV
jgi:hypothetical protein